MRAHARRRLRSALLLAVPVLVLAGCATVKPYEREYLADPIMDLSLASRAESRDQKWLEAREGSTGGSGGAGGGCACN